MFNVTVTFEAGESIKALLFGLMKSVIPVEPMLEKELKPTGPVKPTESVKSEKPAVPEKTAAPAKTEKPAMSAKTEKPAASAKSAEPEFSELDDDAKLEKIKAEVTKLTKNRKGADVKWILGQFDAASVSKTNPLSPESYDDFYEALTRYGKGEALTDIFPEEELD